MTADELRSVASRELALWTQRQRVYLQGEIAQLTANPATAAQAAPLQTQLASLDADMAQALSEIDPTQTAGSARASVTSA